MAAKKKDVGFKIPVTFSKKPSEEIALRAFLFDRKGKLIESVPVTKGEAQFKAEIKSKSDAQLLIVPDREDVENETNLKVLEARYKAYKPIFTLDAKRKLTILPIPELFFPFWFFKKCNVTGNVSKDFDISGTITRTGLCNMRVHICEVDRISWLVPRIPDYIIERIPDIIFNPTIPVPVPILPDLPRPIPRPIPGPIPIPIPFPNVAPRPLNAIPRLDIQNFNVNSIFEAGDFRKPRIENVNIDPDIEGALTLQPILANKKIVSALQSRNVDLIRKSIISDFQLFHPIFCFTQWLWPYFYRCDELKTVYTDDNGDFSTEIYYNIFGDKPDLYFWVEAHVDDVWTTVYKPNIPCNTFWNYNCGTSVNIVVTDPHVSIECTENLDGEVIWIKTIGSGTSVSRIEQMDVSAPVQGVSLNRQGLTDRFEAKGNYRRPFGSNLRFVVQFSSAVRSNRYTYYRWSYKKMNNADLSPAVGITRQLDNVVNKRYSFVDEFIPGSFRIDYNYIKLGPVNQGTETNLYEIPTGSPTDAPYSVMENDAAWNRDTSTIGFDSQLDGDGLYEFTLELFDSGGNKLTDIPNDLFQVPHKETFSPSEFAPAINLVATGPNTCSAFKMVMRLDNSRCEAAVSKIKVDGTEVNATCCGFVDYEPGSDIEIEFRAFHPQNFADLSFRVQKGTCSDSGQTMKTNTSGMVIADAPTGMGLPYDRDAFSIYRKTFSPGDLLGICTAEGKAAFAEHLHVNALTINGDHEVNTYDAGALAAFALEPRS